MQEPPSHTSSSRHADPLTETEALRREVAELRATASKDQAELAAKVRDLEALGRRASLLQKVTAAMATAATVQEVADVVTSHGEELFGATASLLFLLDDLGGRDGDGRNLDLVSYAGAPLSRVESFRRMPLHLDLPLPHAVRTGEAVWLRGHDEVATAFPAAAAFRRGEARLEGVVVLPLRTTSAVIGGLAFSFYAQPNLDPVARDFFLTVCTQCALAIGRALSFDAERRAHEALQRQQERIAVLAQATERLASSLDSRHALAELVKHVVPSLADWCAIDELAPDSTIRRLAVAHREPSKIALAHELVEKYPPKPDAPHGVPFVLRTGQSEWVPDIPDELLVATTEDEEHLALMRSLGLTSYAVVPVVARGRVLGALTLVSEGGRRLVSEDLGFAEELARRAAMALDNARLYEGVARSEARMRALVDATAAIVWTATPRGEVVEPSSSWLAFTGQTEAEYLGGGFATAIHPDDREATFASWRAAIAAQGPYASEYRLRRRDGSYAYMLARGMPVAGPDGTVVEYIGCNVDVSDLRRAEAAAREHAETLAVTNRELDQFAYVTSHDLKAPLRAIGSLAEWIEEDLGPAMTEDVRTKMDLLRGRVRRMEALIQGILDFSRAGRLQSKREPVDAGRLVTEIVELIGVQPPAAVVPGEGLPKLETEKIALQQVLMNLIGNALKHARRPDVLVRLDARDAGDAWEFRVRDNGPGIAPEYHDRVWGIFQTLEARDKVENTGIGLAIVKKIVEGRGGRTWIESAEGEGASVLFTWPKREARRA
jgi:PAS domain S-box-containing protein